MLTIESYRQWKNELLTDSEFFNLTAGAFLHRPELAVQIQKVDRLQPVLVRCACCRFTCAIQDLNHLVELVEASADDYIRDVSLITGGHAGGQ